MSATRGIEADYLVVGAGAMGMAFVDTLLTESDATVAMVDRYHRPGGHWTVASPYVRLHQPSSFYGVGSTELGSGRIDEAAGVRGDRRGAVCAAERSGHRARAGRPLHGRRRRQDRRRRLLVAAGQRGWARAADVDHAA
ncbi:hypothetical protein KUTG_08795 [Kutzneria sp. 744]|nr:hypothetical protein KUTG_08795 [Kutzneria sp. 744]